MENWSPSIRKGGLPFSFCKTICRGSLFFFLQEALLLGKPLAAGRRLVAGRGHPPKRAHRIVPQSRWMATMSFDDFPDLYTLTSATSRKVAQIQEHPIVYWMFSNHDLSFIVNLTGRAEIYLHEAEAMKRIWQQIADKSSAFRVCTSEGAQLPVLSNPSMICGLDPRIGLRGDKLYDKIVTLSRVPWSAERLVPVSRSQKGSTEPGVSALS